MLHSQLPFVSVVCNTNPSFYLYLTGLLELCIFFQQIMRIFWVNYGPKIPNYVGIMWIPKSLQNRMPEILCLFVILANAFRIEALALCAKTVLYLQKKFSMHLSRYEKNIALIILWRKLCAIISVFWSYALRAK